jgi:phage terminase large subunit GpA-like protein
MQTEDLDAHYAVALSDVAGGHLALRPPKRVRISEGAAANLIISQPGAAGGPWKAEETPYMPTPMDDLASREHEAVVFVGPARTGKTAGLLLGWACHNVVNDPGDMLFLQMGREKAREFSKTDVDRAIRYSPNVRAMKSTRAVDSNTFDTMFRHGMWLRIAWPTITNVSGSTYRYVAITDIDRIENAEDVDGEGPLFDLAKKRTTTFMSRGMTLVESSPGKEITDPGWVSATPHEAPPVKGILSIYNRGDRHRWYWQCPDCDDWFEAAPGLSLFRLPADDVLMENIRTMDVAAEAKRLSVHITCPCCGVLIPWTKRKAMNDNGRWLAEGQTIDSDGVVHGERPKATIASYWLGGVAAAYQSWYSLVERYLQALREYALTGSESTLKYTVTADQGMPYISRRLLESAAAKRSPLERAAKGLQRHVAPDWTRLVVASVDVQGGTGARFVVQVHAVGPWMEQQLIDRFEIRESAREGVGADKAPIDPAGYAEDWDQITNKVLLATWRTSTDGREIRAKMVVVDTGGEGKGNGGEGVTHNAYAWYRRTRLLGLNKRVTLYKGASIPTAPVIKKSMVGRRDTSEPGDVPLYVCNPHLLSDAVDAGLRRESPGPGYIHFPEPRHPTRNPDGWVTQAFFDELGAEVRGPNGIWQKVRRRNEAFDLCRMIHAGLLRLGLDKMRSWDVVPPWLAPLDQNDEVITAEDRRAMKANEVVAPPPQVRVVSRTQRRERRVAASPYLNG